MHAQKLKYPFNKRKKHALTAQIYNTMHKWICIYGTRIRPIWISQ